MKFGVCCLPEQAEIVQSIGFDFFEMNFANTAQMSDEAFAKTADAVQALSIRPLAMNIMLSGSFRLTGDAADPEKTKPFLQKGFQRAALLGTKTVVFGSGGARNLPEGDTDRRRAYDQIVTFADLAGSLAAKHGLVIAVEPLAFQEANIVNLLAEAAYIAHRVGRENVRILADLYHMAENREPPQVLLDHGASLQHCHVACKGSRTFPEPDDGHDYESYFAALRQVGYEGTMSIEGNAPTEFAAKAKASLTYLRKMAAKGSARGEDHE